MLVNFSYNDKQYEASRVRQSKIIENNDIFKESAIIYVGSMLVVQ